MGESMEDPIILESFFLPFITQSTGLKV